MPAAFAHLDKRTLVRISTEIAVADDPRAIRATPAVAQLNRELEAYWRGLRDGQSVESRSRFEAAVARARALNLDYQTAADLAQGPLDEILRRVQVLIDRNSVDDEAEVAAVMGGETPPALRLSNMFEEYRSLQEQSLRDMSEAQRHRWGLPKKRAVENLREALGGEDKPLADLVRADALRFRRWWKEKLDRDDLELATANKDFGHVGRMFTAIDEAHQLNLQPVFSKMRFEGEQVGQREAFTREYIQEALLAPGALEGLNDEAMDIVLLMMNTGLRPSEMVNLDEATIILAGAVPYVAVRPVDRRLKNTQSERDIPLVGVSLAAARRHPNGFPRYRHKADNLSAAVNKFLESRKLLPTEDHSLYSFRHTFEDSLTEVEAPDKLIAALMGHKHYRPKYGKGPSLAQKRKWLLKIAFNSPAQP